MKTKNQKPTDEKDTAKVLVSRESRIIIRTYAGANDCSIQEAADKLIAAGHRHLEMRDS